MAKVSQAPTGKDCCTVIAVGDEVTHRLGMTIGPNDATAYIVTSIELESNGHYYVYGDAPGQGNDAQAMHLRRNHAG